jgi:hypothetical protein
MQYTPEQRDEALRLLAEVGKAEAARRTGIPAGTIASWGARRGVSAPSPEEWQKAHAAQVATMAGRKQQLATDLGTLAAKAVAKLAERIDADEVSAKDLVSALTAAVDRLQLLTGDATARIEQTGDAAKPERAKLVSVVDQLAERRAS